MQQATDISGPRLDVAGTGFTVLDKVYHDGELSDEALGGSCGNVLASLAMLDRHVAPVLRLGDDDEGDLLISEFVQAGAVVDFISRHSGLRSPILTVEIDTRLTDHTFSFTCPETDSALPTYEPIALHELCHAELVFSVCSIFYTDRLSRSILDAMDLAHRSGAVIVFEPSDIDDDALFREALRMTTVLKTAADRLDGALDGPLERASPRVRVTTHGAAGLEIIDESQDIWCAAVPATQLRDACGSGDMVTVGIIDWLLANAYSPDHVSAESLHQGVIAGQRLAAENCAYEGARGLFRHRGAAYARSILRQQHP
jgi:fructokinase